MKGLIIVPGEAEGLKPLVKITPVSLFPVVNKPLIEHQVEFLARGGVEDIRVVVSDHPEKVKRYLGDGKRWGCRISYMVEKNPTGIAATLEKINRFKDEDLVVIRGDVIPDFSLDEVIRDFNAKECDILLIGASGITGGGYGECSLGPEDKLEDPDNEGDGDPVRVNLLGVYLLSHSASVSGDDNLVDASVFASAAAGGARVSIRRVEGGGNRISDFKTYWEINMEVLREEYKNLLIPRHRVEEGVWLGRNVSIPPSAEVKSPVIIGDNCQLKKGCRIGPGAVVGDNVIVDRDAIVENSVVWEGTYIGEGTEINQCVVSRGHLINAPRGSHTFVSERFLLGDVREKILRRKFSRVLNAGGAFLLALLTLPLFGLVALLVKLNSRGPVLLSEEYVRGNLPQELSGGLPLVRLSRFRVHRPGRDELTWSGKFIRRFSLDFLPRLWNVIGGKMNLVGNIPVTEKTALQLMEEWQNVRFQGPLGITGLARISPGETSSPEELAVIESFYAVESSFFLNLKGLKNYPDEG